MRLGGPRIRKHIFLALWEWGVEDLPPPFHVGSEASSGYTSSLCVAAIQRPLPARPAAHGRQEEVCVVGTVGALRERALNGRADGRMCHCALGLSCPHRIYSPGHTPSSPPSILHTL